jgi:hypothetical protein
MEPGAKSNAAPRGSWKRTVSWWGYVDEGLKCDNEVALREDGFDFETCFPGEKRYVRTGDEFKATVGPMVYTLRPAP